MFGYIRPQRSELLVREFEEYNGIYCTLCRRLGNEYGPAVRMALNYDCTFFALVYLAVAKKACPEFYKGHCAVNPLKKCVFCQETDDKGFQMAAALTVLLAYYKIQDDIRDSKFIKKLLFWFLCPFVLLARKKAAAKFPRFDEIISRAIKIQNELESTDCPVLDQCAESTAEMLAKIFETIGAEDSDRSQAKIRILHQFGYFLGRWVYLIDAAEDIEEDLHSESFNPFIINFHLDLGSSRDEIAQVKNYANQVLNDTLTQLGSAANLLNFNRLGSIIHNVIFNGLPQMQRNRLFEKESRNVGSV